MYNFLKRQRDMHRDQKLVQEKDRYRDRKETGWEEIKRQEGNGLKKFDKGRQMKRGPEVEWGDQRNGGKKRREKKKGRKEKGQKESKCVLFPDEAHI